MPPLWWWKRYLVLMGQSWGDPPHPPADSLPALLPSVCPIKPMCDPGVWLFCLVWVSSGLWEWLRIYDLHQFWSKAKLMPSFLLSSLMLGLRPSIPEKLIETEHQLQFSSTMGKLMVTGWGIFFSFCQGSCWALSWSGPSQDSLGLCEVIEWATRQEQQAANLLIAAWLSEIAFLFGSLGLDEWLCICKRTYQVTLSQTKGCYSVEVKTHWSR